MADKTKNVSAIQLKGGTSAKIKASTYVPKAREVIVSTDSNEMFIGDGKTQLKALASTNSPVLSKLETMDAKLDQLLLFKPALADCSWGQIKAISESGNAAAAFKVGDEKTITLSTGEEVTLVILGFNHDDVTSGGKAGITFGMKNLLATKYPMNSSSDNTGGWDKSVMRTSTMATLLGQLPADLQAAIKAVNKKASAGAQSTSITTSSDKLFLLAEIEVFGSKSYSVTGEGTQYAYYRDIANTASARIKKLSNGSGSANNWWLRSPYVSNSTYFCGVNTSGIADNYNASNSNGVAFGFCV